MLQAINTKKNNWFGSLAGRGWKRSLSVLSICFFLFLTTIPSAALAGSFFQTDWSDGVPGDETACISAGGVWASGECLAQDPDDQTGWAAYSSKGTDIIAANSGLDLELGSVSTSATHTSQADFTTNNNRNKAHTTQDDFSTDATLSSVHVTNSIYLGVISHTPTWTTNAGWDMGDIGSRSSLALGDLDGDGDFDVLGGQSSGTTKVYENTGSVTSPVWTHVANWDIEDIGSSAAPALADLDGDGDLDVLIGSGAGVSYGYRNTGTIGPVWEAEPDWNTVDIGSSATPAFVQLGGDDDFDLVIGHNSGTSQAYENTGDSTSPSWTNKDEWDLPDVGVSANPYFVDIDFDGDYDAFVGNYCELVQAYENQGSNSSPNWQRKTEWEPNLVPTDCFLDYSSPALADLDNDGDMDLLFGRSSGLVNAYENTGATTYESSGTVLSKVIDTGGHVGFDTLEYTALEPANTTLTIDIRAGDSDTVDGSWTAWQLDVADGGDISALGNKQYFQYRVNLSNTVATVTPVLHDITINYLNFPFGSNIHANTHDQLTLGMEWAPSTTGFYAAGRFLRNVFVSGNYLYGAYQSRFAPRLMIYDISDTSAPSFVTEVAYPNKIISSLNKFFGVNDVFVSGNYVYVAVGEYGLDIVDISDPSTPTTVGTFDTGDTACNLFVSDNVAYIADFRAGLQVIDVSNPAAPTHLGWYDTDGNNCQGLYVSGNYLYLSNDIEGLSIFDVSDPSQPNKLTEIAGTTYDVWVDGDYAYLVGVGLQVYDVSNPSLPSLVASNSNIIEGTNLYFEDNILYVVDGGVLKFIDVSDPSSPVIKASHESSLGDIHVVDGVVYAGTSEVKVIKRGVYQSPGELVSSVIDMGEHLGYTTLDYTATEPTDTTLTIDVRAGNTAAPDGTWSAWISDVADGGSIAALPVAQYFQYRVNMSTTNTDLTPSLDDITVNVATYSTSSALVSSPYDTGDANNLLSSIGWNETLPVNTDIRIQLRTAEDDGGSPGVWSEWFGPDSSSNSYWNSANTTATDSGQCSGSGSITCKPASIARDLIGDQWFQYKVEAVTNDPDSTPTFSDVTLSYTTGATASGEVIVSQTSGLSTTEVGGTDSFTIKLNSPPSADVTIDLYSTDISEGVISPSQVMFNNSTWNDPVTIVVTGVADDIDDGSVGYSIVLGSTISSDGSFDNLNPPDVTVTNSDDDTAGITVNSFDGIATTENQTVDSFTVMLDSEPTANVTINISSDDTTEATVDKSTLTFTPANWNTVQTVYVTGVDDDSVDGSTGYNVIIDVAAGDDGLYSAMNPADLPAVNDDNDSAGIIITPNTGLTTTEKGGGASFTVKLSAKPSALVSFRLESSDTTEGDISLLSRNYYFQPSEWNKEKTGLITGKNDGIIDPAEEYFINIKSVTSTDPVWNGITPAPVPVTNIDDDSYTATVVQLSDSATSEEGGFVEFVIRLSTKPSSNVTIPLSVTDTTEATVVSSVTFTPTDLPWIGKSVFVYGVDDRELDGWVDFELVIGETQTDDPNFQNIDLDDIPLVNADDESPGSVITGGSINAEFGSSVASGDFNNDNIPDLLVGAPEDTGEGRARVYLGTALGYSNTPSWTMVGAYNIKLGNAVAAGDFNNDGYDDVVIAADHETGDSPSNQFREGRVYVFYGSASGLPDADEDGLGQISDASWVVESDQSYAHLGKSIAVANVNNDAYADLIASAYLYDNDQSNEGRVFVFHGSAGGLPYTDCGGFADGIAHPCEADWMAEGDFVTGYFGRSVARAGDVNGDNIDDIIIGSDVYENGTSDEGRALVYYGSGSGLPYTNCDGSSDGIAHPCEAAWQVESDVWGAQLGRHVAGAGDINNDGFDDVIIGAPYTDNPSTNAGSAYVFYGSINGLSDAGMDGQAYLSDADWQLEGSVKYDYLGWAFTGGFDFNADNIDDVALGVRSEGVGGKVLIFYGVQTTGLNSTADWQYVETSTSLRQIGSSLTSIADYNNDGYDEIVTGASESSISVHKEGAVKIISPNVTAPGFIISPASGLQTTESGGAASFTVRLTAFPEDEVTLSLSSLETDEGTISHNNLTFTQENWSTPQTVIVTGVNDTVTDGNNPYVIKTDASVSADPAYDGIDPVNISVTNIDNDVPQEVTVVGNGTVDENSGTGVFTFTRLGEITDDLTVNYSVSGTATGGDDYVALSGVVTIPTGSPSVAVYVTPTKNSIVESNESVIVSIDTNSDYLVGSPGSATVTIADDDTAGIIVDTISTLTTEAGGVASFTVKLNSQPSDDVTIEYSSDDPTEGSVFPASLVFASGDWYIPQTVTVTGNGDGIVDNDVHYTVSAAGASSADSDYSGLVGPSVELVNLDDGSRATLSLSVRKSVIDEASTGYAGFIVSRTGLTTDPLNIFYTVVGTAIPSVDYHSIGNMATIPAGESSVDINVFPVQDSLREPIETVVINILNSSDYIVANPTSATISLTDDESPVPPFVNFMLDQVVGEGDSFTVTAELSSEASSYPVTIPFTVDGTALNPSDHDVVAGNIEISSGTTGSSNVFTTVNDGPGEGDEFITFTMGEPSNVLLGTNTLHTVTLTEANIKPEVTLASEQLAVSTRLIVNGDGDVTVTATVNDPNPSDIHGYDWSATNNSLVDIPESGTDDPATFVFDSSGLADGFYAVRLTVTDNGSGFLSSDVELLLEVVSSAPTLASDVDSDGDSVMDADESFDDSDGDGIPDYLDSEAFAQNELQILSGENVSYIMHTEVGLSLKLGETAFAAGADGALVSVEDIEAYGGGEGQSGTASANDTVTNVGGYFDFEVAGLKTAGQSVKIVIPQLVALPGGAGYRKYHPDYGWADFVEDEYNSLASALGSPGECPPPGSDLYVSGLNEGHHCVQLEIQDGGPNDMDGVANYVIQDPGQFAQVSSSQGEGGSSGGESPALGSVGGSGSTSGSGGGGALSASGLLLLMFLLGIAALKRKQVSCALPAVGVALVVVFMSQETQAEFTLDFTPKTENAYMATDYYFGGGTMQLSDCRPNCTPYLLDEQVLDQYGVEQPEIVYDPVTNATYIHMVVGSLESGFIQETYIEVVDNLDCFGGYCWARGAYDGDTTSVSLDGWGNSIQPLDNDPTYSGSGTANPKRILLRQIVNDGEMTSEFLKDSYSRKPAIAQVISNGEIEVTTLIDMRNSDYDTDYIGGVVINTMSLHGDIPFDSGSFNSLTDSQDAVVNAGKFKYIEGSGKGGASGTYEYEGREYDTMSIDWVEYFDPNDPTNVWSVEDFIPE